MAKIIYFRFIVIKLFLFPFRIRKAPGQTKLNTVERGVGAKGTSVLKKGDARLKIIQKNRSKLTDARDKLAQMAKKTDARAKLLKLRQMRTVITIF